ncbi:hypothetical protein IV102_14100 [bacterium]|nr:hypothetical protein [bacterium]
MQIQAKPPTSPQARISGVNPKATSGPLDTIEDLYTKAKAELKEDGWVYAAGAGLFAGIGTLAGGVVGAPALGALKGLQIFTLTAGGDAIMTNKTFESKIFNWSNTMPAEAGTPDDVDYQDPKTNRLFYANLATNAAVVLSVPAAIGAVAFGLPGALAVGALALAAAPFAPLL